MNILSLIGSKYLWIACGVLVLALIGSGLLLKQAYTTQGALKADLNTATDALEATQELRRLDQEVERTRAAARVKQAADAATSMQALERALGKAQTWADTPLPPEVANALR